MKFEAVSEIAAPASDVWSVLTDVTRWPEWTPTMRTVRRLDDGPFGPGSSAKIRQPRLPRAVWRVVEFEPGRGFAWTSAGPGVLSRGDHRVEPLGAHRCRVTVSIETTGPLARPLWLLIGGLTRRYVSTEATCLKRHCEAGQARGR